MNLIDFLTSPVANALGWTLFHALWQGFAIVLPTAVILHLLRHGSSTLRYQIGVLALPGQLLASIATFWAYYQPIVAVSLSNTNVAMKATTSLPVRWQVLTQTLPWHQQVQQFLESHLSQFVFVYLIGIAIFGLRLAGSWLYLQRLSQAAVEPATNTLINLTGKLRVTLSLRAVVRVRESARIAVPMVVGMLKPVLLLPIGLMTNLSMREIEAVLAHELAHVKRHDYAVNLLQSVMEVLYFFHPALWWLSARIREEREHCCDDLAIQACGGNGRMLAQALARVEELRHTGNRSTPALAMALSSGRHLLLHRVRRMLGVATRPMVSNGSLAGLTLATLLLVSASVYAIQQEQPVPKSRISKSQPARRYKVAKGTEVGFTEDRKIKYVTWKGKKLPAAHVTRLQHQLDQVMAGQLSLDDVKQPDRDILLAIIETNATSSVNKDAVQESLAHIDYDNLVASALNNVSISLDDTAEKMEAVSHSGIIEDAFASLEQPRISIDSLGQRRGYFHRQIDSLSQLMAQRSQQMQTIQLQMEKMRFPIEELQRNAEVLNWRKDKLMEQRNALIEKHQRLLQNNGKAKMSQADIEKQLTSLEPEIKKLEVSMEELNGQFEVINAKQGELKQPIEKLEREAEQLEEQVEKLSKQAEKYSIRAMRVVDGDIMTETAYILRPARVPRPPRPITGTATLLPPARPSSAPKVRSLTGVIEPATPAIPARPAAVPKVAPSPRALTGKAVPALPARPATPKAATRPNE